ncbi:AEC family transporter [Chlorobium phaeobacteroides]|uniref:Auxin Efflux Carrier n=1 Tax=Chlorobium phaeobacteroides (strain DSM 266 / SMG 266 / 2430) TaxID=290317 RepID=A1BEN0_CHLPD|nr:AEC family transporter [Chlorobium phaeobacteroides]ABL64857.1 Auxin Efflux Carrier [Chlorobium phaeobacteroides DSM 266]
MSDIVFLLAPIFVFFLIGFVLQRARVIDAPASSFLLKLVYTLTLPALVLSLFPYVVISQGMLFLPVISGCIVLGTLAAALATGKVLSMPPKSYAVLASGSMIMNLSIVIPFVKSFYGDEGLSRLVLFDFINGLAAFTIAYSISCRYGASGHQGIAKRLLSSPPLWALIAGLLMNFLSLRFNPLSANILHSIGELTSPLLLLALGASIKLSKINPLYLAAGVFTRMVLGFALGLGLAELFRLQGIDRAIAVLCAAAPAGFNTLTFASLEKLDVDYATTLVTITMIIAMLIMPILLTLL